MVGHNVLRIGRYFVSLCADSAPKAGNTVGSDLLIKLFKDMKKLLFAFGAAAMLVVSNVHLIYYLPALLIGGAVTGTLIGITAAKIWECLRLSGKIVPINH